MSNIGRSRYTWFCIYHFISEKLLLIKSFKWSILKNSILKSLFLYVYAKDKINKLRIPKIWYIYTILKFYLKTDMAKYVRKGLCVLGVFLITTKPGEIMSCWWYCSEKLIYLFTLTRLKDLEFFFLNGLCII